MNNQIVTYMDRKWHALTSTGRILSSHPPGPDGRHAALVDALKWRQPLVLAAVQQLIRKHRRPELTSRLWKAAELVTAGHVNMPAYGGSPAELCRVKSSKKNKYYPQSISDGRLWCNCDDRSKPTIGRSEFCKHSLAVLLAQLADITPTPWPAAEPNTQTFYSRVELSRMDADARRRWGDLAAATRDRANLQPQPEPHEDGQPLPAHTQAVIIRNRDRSRSRHTADPEVGQALAVMADHAAVI